MKAGECLVKKNSLSVIEPLLTLVGFSSHLEAAGFLLPWGNGYVSPDSSSSEIHSSEETGCVCGCAISMNQ